MLQPTGTKIGKYEIRAELGRGAMGVVYVAHDPVLDRKVALKVMAANILEDPDLKERFRREAQAVAKLQSPNIVTVYDFGYHQDAPYIAMEMLSGTDLEAKLRSSTPPNLAEKINVVTQVCKGLSHAHEEGIVHRDIKPANIFVTETGLVKIMDFGTARLNQSTQTQTGTVMGTVAYMSPEQIQGKKVDGRSDIFSLGVLFYRLLCHQQPFGGENIHHIIYKILNVQPANLVLPEGVQVPSLQFIVDKALAKTLEQRYQTAEDMASDLEAFEKGQSASIAEDTIFRTLAAGEVGTVPEVGSASSGQTVGGATIPVAAGQQTAGPQAAAGSSTHLSIDSDILEGETIKTEHLEAKAIAPPTMSHYPAKKKSPPWLAIGLAAAIAAFVGGYLVLGGKGKDTDSSVANTQVADTTPVSGVDVASGDGSNAATDSTTTAPVDAAGGNATGGSTTGQDPVATTTPSTTNDSSTADRPVQTTPPPPQQAAPPPPRQQSPPPPVSSPPTNNNASSARRVQSTIDSVRTALAGGQLSQAQSLIDDGRKLDAGNPIWGLLENERLVAGSNLRGNTLLSEGLDFFSKGDTAQAVAAYDQALAAFAVAAGLAPGNAATLQGKLNATNFKNQALNSGRQQQAAVPEKTRQFTESQTSFVVETKSSGFQDDGEIAVQQATRTTSIPGELLIEILPRNAEIGAPYSLKVRLRNKSNSVIFAKSMLLISTFKGQKIGADRPKDLNLRRVEPQSTAVLFETQDTWTEDLNQGGSIEAKVTLAKNGQLIKTLEWSAP